MRPKPLMPILTIVCVFEFGIFRGGRPTAPGGHVNIHGKQEPGRGRPPFRSQAAELYFSAKNRGGPWASLLPLEDQAAKLSEITSTCLLFMPDTHRQLDRRARITMFRQMLRCLGDRNFYRCVRIEI